MAKVGYVQKPKDMKKTLKRFSRYLGYHSLSVAMVALLVVISASAKLFGTYLLKPIINNYIVPGDYAGLVEKLLLMGVIYVIGAFCTLGYTQLMVAVAQKIVKELRRDLFEKMQDMSLKFFDSKTHGELMSRFTNDIETISEALNNSFTSLIQSFIVIIGSVSMIIILNIKLSVIVLIAFLCMSAYIAYSGKKSKYYFSQQQKYIGELNGFIEEMVEGQKVVKIFNHEAQDFEKFDKKNERLRDSSTRAFTYSGTMIPVVVSVSYLSYAITACVGGLFSLAGLMTVGSLASYLVYVREAAMPINQFSQQMNFVINAISGAERIFELMDSEPEIDEGTVTLTRVMEDEHGVLHESTESVRNWAWRKPREDGSMELIPLKGDVRFHDVIFGYNENQTILKKVNLYAKPGQKIAFVGSTGAGKTTITNLINRFYELNSGSITYDGIDITNIKKDDLRRSMSVVLQDTHLFTGTIAENIHYGRLNASMKDVVQAAKIANADSFIRRLPDGYDTMLEGDGANLSQGQRQLLAIARAAISRSPVLVLDEATSSIDTHTEKLIEKGMDRLMEERTVFVIAHRLSTVRNAKAIIVLNHGEIIERGTHEELLEEKGRYYQLYTGQFELS